MNVISLFFFCLVVTTVFIYWLLPFKYQTIFLVIVSYIFYMCYDIKSVLFLLFSTMSTFIAGILLERYSSQNIRKLIFLSTLIINIFILFLFKYLDFFNLNIQTIFKHINIHYTAPSMKLIVPLGISFYTFQIIGYLIDIYTGKIKSERNFFIYALYVSFFPKIMQGPIERTDNFLVQIREEREFQYKSFLENFMLILCGIFKKIMIADRLGVIVNNVYGNINDFTGIYYLIVAFFYSIQIYCDFSGYTDIARGCAGLMGFNLIENFKHPYLSNSIKDFWRRWHISLTRWFTEYIYIPLGGSRKGKLRWALNTGIVFMISGLWHGASWSFIIWGIIHAVYQIVGKFSSGIKTNVLSFLHLNNNFLYKIGSVLVNFSLITFAWIFFRANTFNEALLVIKGIFTIDNFNVDISLLNLTVNDVIIIIVLLILFVLYEIIDDKKPIICLVTKQVLVVRWSIYLLLIFTMIMFGVYGKLSAASFIYLQF